MKYKISFSVTENYPQAEVEAKDRDEAIKLYQNLWKEGKLSREVVKDARYSIQSVWKANSK